VVSVSRFVTIIDYRSKYRLYSVLILIILMKRRTHTELVCDVLDAIDSGTRKPTHIIYDTRLNWKSYKEIISNLLEKNFVEAKRSDEQSTRNKVKYYLTDEGEKVREGLQYMNDMLTAS